MRAALLALAAVVAAAGEVLMLDDDTFDAAIVEHDPLLVAFVAPWCGHCKSLKPEYAKAAKALAADGFKLAQVDATASQDLATRFEITGFPTLKFFRGGKPSEYNGGRDEASIVAWVRKKSGPATSAISTAAQLDALTEANDVIVVAVVTEGSSLAAAVAAAAAEDEAVPFAVVSATAPEAAALREQLGVATGAEGVVSLNAFEGEPNAVRYELPAEGEAVTAAAVSAWSAAHALPLVVTFSQETAPKIFRGDHQTHFLLFADLPSDEEEAGEVAVDEAGEPVGSSGIPAHLASAAAFRAAAAGGKGRSLFVRVPSSEDRVLGYFGIEAEALPALVLVHMSQAGGMKKYRFDGEHSAAAIGSFLDAYEAGSLKPWLKSDPAPDAAANAAAPVRVVVGSTFAAEVQAGTADVLLEVYAPWCGHCKALEPIYAALGAAVKAAGLGDKLVIAKLDGTSNEVDAPGFNVRGFPTIFFFAGGDKSAAVEFDGARDIEGFVAFLKEHATNDLSTLDADAIEVPDEEDDEEDEEEDHSGHDHSGHDHAHAH